MKLSVYDRLLILNIFEKYKSNLLNAETVKNGKKAIVFTEEEMDGLQLHLDNNGVPHWMKNEYDIEKEFDLSNRFLVIIEDKLKELEKEKLISPEIVDFFHKFVK